MQWKMENNRPLSIQIQEQIIIQIVAGRYRLGEKLPSEKTLAEEAKLNPNTMTQALEALDKTGLTVKTENGRIITANEDILNGLRAVMLQTLIEHFYQSAAEFGYTKEQVIEQINRSEGK